MKEAKQRNPDMITYGLPWGAPGWINNQSGYYGPDMITYQVEWLKCARDHGVSQHSNYHIKLIWLLRLSD